MNGPARTIRLGDGTAIDAKAVILATGVSYRQLNAPGCTEMTGAGVYYGAALTEAEECKDQDVFVVGGANSAGQAAVYLSKFARSVTMLVRAHSLEESMSYYLIQQIAGIPNISVRNCTEVAEVYGDGHLERLELRDLAAGTTEIVDAGQLFIFIGAAPRTGWLDGVVARDKHGFVLSGPDLAEQNGQTTRTITAGGSTASPTTWRRACPVCSRSATSAPSRPSGSRRRSARAPWRSCSCTATWRPSSETRQQDPGNGRRPQ